MSNLPFVILASSSPRRQQLMRQMGAEFIVTAPDVEEKVLPGERPEQIVERLALMKAQAARHDRTEGVVLGSDTIVVLGEEVLGKPADADDACRMLARLSGHTHTVFTGFALLDLASGRQIVDHEQTDVTFRTLDAGEIEHYVATGSPLDKAGAYGIQDDFGAVFIERIAGDYYTVVGLPLARVYVALRSLRR
ncbi:MAG: septum formation protein Maf [Bacteroidetes bacterium]|nr:septum formation protein Maf [Bacteroidota bacterium]